MGFSVQVRRRHPGHPESAGQGRGHFPHLGRLTRTRPEEEDGSQGPYPPLHHRRLRLLHEEVKVVGPQVKEDRVHAQELQANFRLNLILPPPTPTHHMEP